MGDFEHFNKNICWRPILMFSVYIFLNNDF